MDKRPKVGTGVIVIKDNKVLLGKRKSEHGKGVWGFPGGHLEFGESITECARRETLEETGIDVHEAEKWVYTNDIFKETGKHYITLFFIVKKFSGEPKVMEPHKFEKWDWFSWDELPRPLFLPIENLIEKGHNPFEN